MLLALIFNKSVFWLAGLVLYVGVWAILAVRMLRAIHHHDGIIDIQEVARYNYLAAAWRKFAWILSLMLVLVLSLLVPDVCIVSTAPIGNGNDIVSARYKSIDEGDPVVERVYVPMWYRGELCMPFKSYLYNNLDDTLMLYRTVITGYRYGEVTQKVYIMPGEMIEFNHNIRNYFTRPWVSCRKYTYDLNEKETVEWSLEIKSKAEESVEELNNSIHQVFKLPIPITYPLSENTMVHDDFDSTKEAQDVILRHKHYMAPPKLLETPEIKETPENNLSDPFKAREEWLDSILQVAHRFDSLIEVYKRDTSRIVIPNIPPNDSARDHHQ